MTSDLDRICRDVCLNHHEKWDGTGYPGEGSGRPEEHQAMGSGKKGEEIPLPGRIVAVADVYDALVSKRVYKTAWNEEETLSYIRSESGKHFDPELAEAFLSIYDVIKAIEEKYKEE